MTRFPSALSSNSPLVSSRSLLNAFKVHSFQHTTLRALLPTTRPTLTCTRDPAAAPASSPTQRCSPCTSARSKTRLPPLRANRPGSRFPCGGLQRASVPSLHNTPSNLHNKVLYSPLSFLRANVRDFVANN